MARRPGITTNVHRGPTYTRTHQTIVQMLCDAHADGRAVSKEEVADATGMTVRSAVRRMTELKHLGVGIITVGAWGETRYQLSNAYIQRITAHTTHTPN